MRKYTCLSKKQAKEVRQLFESGEHTREEIAKAYNVSAGVIGKIVSGTWKPKVKARRKRKKPEQRIFQVRVRDDVIDRLDALVAECDSTRVDLVNSAILAYRKPWWRLWA